MYFHKFPYSSFNAFKKVKTWGVSFFMKARYLTEEEIQKIRAAAGWAAWLPFQVSIYTGLRIGDVLALRTENVVGDHVLYRAEKTGKIGCAVLPRNLAFDLKLLAKWGWCFPGRKKGQHLTRQAAWYRVKKACKLAGVDIEGVSPHSFRKVFAVGEFRATHNLNRVRVLLQHDRAETTLGYALADQLAEIDADSPSPPEDRGGGVDPRS